MQIRVLDFFKTNVDNRINDVAVVHNDASITFGELDEKSDVLARGLRKRLTSNGPVAVYLPKEIGGVIADIGILKSDNSFMNLDIKTPNERIINIINQVQPVAIISRRDLFPRELLDSMDAVLIDIDDALNSSEFSAEYIEAKTEVIDTDLMCIINTSGSTGTPKSVALNHRSFLDFMQWSDEEYHFTGKEIMGSLSPMVFDIFVFELCMLMYKGSTIVILDNTLAMFPVKLLQVMEEKHINFIFWVPSIMVNIANMELLDKFHLGDLKTVWFAGEVFPTKQFCYWFDKLPNADFSNLYGPIEITLDCTYFRVKERPDENEPLPIGIPCNNTDIIILNDNNKRCEVGEEGELCVRGTSLAMGYYNNPEKTNDAFVQNPLNAKYNDLIYRTGDIVLLDNDGLIHFKGRKDSLIKHLGYRIELGEIEHVIVNEIRIVEYCCVVYKSKDKVITLFYEGNEISKLDFRNRLKEVFPSYMIPGEYIHLDSLPRNNNGKIDRNKLNREVNNK